MKQRTWAWFAALVLMGCENDDDRRRLLRDAAVDASPDGNADVGEDSRMDVAEDASSGSSDVAVHGDVAPAIVCLAGSRTCEGNVATACNAGGTASTQITCANGCGDGLCLPLSLAMGWRLHQYDLADDGVKTVANYTFENDGLVAVQSANPMASVYYKDEVLPEGIDVRGRFSIRTASDDDMVGFVFGFQDPEHTYLVDWKQASQSYGTCGLASAGAALKLIKASSPLANCADLWRSTGTEKVTTLVPPTANATGWKDLGVYDFHLRFFPGDILIEIFEGEQKVVSITSSDTTYRNGKFGFYNYSQQNVRYEFFSISPAL